jgi:hypothetical protein
LLENGLSFVFYFHPLIVNLFEFNHNHERLMIMLVFLRAFGAVVLLCLGVRALALTPEADVHDLETSTADALRHLLEL